MLSILSHYQGQFGSFDSFTLPSSIWSGVTTISDYQLTDYRWRYTESPAVDDAYCGLYNVELALETVPPDGAFASGAELVVIITLAPGTVVTTNGLQQSVTLSIAGGSASQVIGGDGLQESITISLVGGTASVITGDEASFWSDWAYYDPDIFLYVEEATADTDSTTSFWSHWKHYDTEIFLYEEGASSVPPTASTTPVYWNGWQSWTEDPPLLFEEST
jgi:hypothetical protein